MTDTTNLMERAQRLDMMSSPEFQEWLGLTNQIDRLRRDLSRARAPGRFVAAIGQHGSPQEARRAAQFELEALSERLEEAAITGAEIEKDRREIGALLNSVSTRSISRGRQLHGLEDALRQEIKRSRQRREQAIGDLVEAGLPRRMAELNARPSIVAIEDMEEELRLIPGEIERNSDLLSSYAARAELYLAETTDEEEAA